MSTEDTADYFRVTMEEDNTAIRVSSDGRSLEIVQEGVQGIDKPDEHLTRVKEMLRGVLTGKLVVKL